MSNNTLSGKNEYLHIKYLLFFIGCRQYYFKNRTSEYPYKNKKQGY